MTYDRQYVANRDRRVDKSEWRDILRVLKKLGARKDHVIIDLGAGSGKLVGWLRSKGYNAKGCDIACKNDASLCSVLVGPCDLLDFGSIPLGDYYILQHVVEHLPQDKAVLLIRYLLEEVKAKGVVAVAPGHYSTDPTHVINHYDERLMLSFARRVGYKALVYPDTFSFINPRYLDWIVVFMPEHGEPRVLDAGFIDPLIRFVRKVVVVYRWLSLKLT